MATRRKCPNCGKEERSQTADSLFCKKCGSAMDKNTPSYVPPIANETTQNTTDTAKPASVDTTKEEIPMKEFNLKKALCLLAALLMVLVAAGWAVDRFVPKTNNATTKPIVVYATTPVVTTAPVAYTEPNVVYAATATVTPENKDLSVYRGVTYQDTINHDNAESGYFSWEKFNWFDADGHSNVHMLGGTYVLPCDGVISGDVVINDVKVYDDNWSTFLVRKVYKGDKIYVNPQWMADFTNEFSENDVVTRVSTKYPTWTRN